MNYPIRVYNLYNVPRLIRYRTASQSCVARRKRVNLFQILDFAKYGAIKTKVYVLKVNKATELIN